MEAAFLSALAEPNRLRIVELLSKRPYTVNEIAKKLGLNQPQASKHLKYLTKAGAVNMHPDAQRRIYTLNPEPFLRLDDWLDSFDYYWSTKLQNLDDYLSKERG